MNEFKRGDRVVCINPCQNLILGNVYIVDSVWGADFIYLQGSVYRFRGSRFREANPEDLLFWGVKADKESSCLSQRPLVIGLTGKARSGKDTVAALLQATQEFRNVETYSFATPLKQMLDVGLQLKDKDDTEAVELYGCNYRKLAQTLGTEWGRELVHSDLWVLIAEQRLKRSRLVIITDVRFENEANFVRERGVLIHVERQGQEAIKESDHISESGVSVLHNDYKILNNSTLQALGYAVRHAAIDLEQMLAHKKE